jgi:hypothetical protein
MQASIGIELATVADKDDIIFRQQQEIQLLREQLESRVGKPIEWLTPLEVQKISEYSAYQVRGIVDRAIENRDRKFTERLHYKRRRVGNQYRYHINWDLIKDLI